MLLHLMHELETAHILRSPANAERLRTALAPVRERQDTLQLIADLRHEVRLDRTE